MTQTTVKRIPFEVAGFSEQGPRSENQDAYAADRFATSGILAVADGMGGEKSGRVAADTALDAVLEAAPFENLDDARRAVREADRAIAALAESNPAVHGGMGCALGVLSLADGGDGNGWIAANVGDVRILSRSPDGVLRLETRDHTPAFARWEAGEIALDEIPDSAGANRLQRAVGRGGEADVSWLPVRSGWSWLIVSDGVYKAMRLEELADAMSMPSAEEACDVIRGKVQERGADDNFTAVFVRALGEPATPIVYPDGKEPMTTSTPTSFRRPSAIGGIAMALALAALVLAGIAFWMAREAIQSGTGAAELERLRFEVDSLRAIVEEVRDPFGPSAPATTPPGVSQPQSP
ncbi:MAG: PP2C family protein-serine/threonine phosphatase [Gemmatimonadota bacterium]